MGFEDFKPIFGEPKPKSINPASVPFRQFLMHVFAPDYYHLTIHVTDFHSNTFEAVKSVTQLEDLRDMIGVGGTWSEFVEYVVASITSEDVKLVLDQNKPDGATSAKLVGQKSKGMPLISISLVKLMDSSANDAIEKLSFALFNALNGKQGQGQKHENNTLELSEKRQKLEEMKTDNASASNDAVQDTDKKQSKKVNNRAVPAFRRAKVRGAVLRDTDADD